jgi:hypothetical protein
MYSPVVEFSNFSVICQYTWARDLGLWRFDIMMAFLHADIKENVGTDTQHDKVWR